jgi:hypothetical protein
MATWLCHSQRAVIFQAEGINVLYLHVLSAAATWYGLGLAMHWVMVSVNLSPRHA